MSYDVVKPFDKGKVLITATASATLSRATIECKLIQHSNGLFGDSSLSDWRSNIEVLTAKKGKIISRYFDDISQKEFFIITELLDSGNITTILMPEEL